MKSVLHTSSQFSVLKFKKSITVFVELINAPILEKLLAKDAKMKKDDAIFNALRDMIKEISPVLFEGDGYSDAWVKEANKRGLYHAQNTPEALQAYVAKKNIMLFLLKTRATH